MIFAPWPTTAGRLTGPNQQWLLGFAEVASANGERWRVTSVADCWSRYEFISHTGPASERGSGEAALALAIMETEHLTDKRLGAQLPVNPTTGEVTTIEVVLDLGWGPAAMRCARYVASFPELTPAWAVPWRARFAQDTMRGLDSVRRTCLDVPPVDENELAEIARWYRLDFNTRWMQRELGGATPALAHLQAHQTG